MIYEEVILDSADGSKFTALELCSILLSQFRSPGHHK